MSADSVSILLLLGLQGPQLVQSLASRNIVKIAAHSDGHHYLALSANGEVFSWGCGDGGRLGHGDTVYVLKTIITFIWKCSEFIVKIILLCM